MSSMTTRLLFLSALLAATSAPALAAPQWSENQAASPASDAAIGTAVMQWNALRQTDGLPFASYANFLVAHPGWPGEAATRKQAEGALRADGEDPRQVIAFFRRYPAQSAAGQLRFAEALDATGSRDEARTTARKAWVMGMLVPSDESRLLTRFAGVLTPEDHDLRMERLLWSRATATATRQLMLTSPARRPFFDARLAMLNKAPDAAAKAALVADRARNDAGYIADRAYWLRNTNQAQAVRALLAQPRTLVAPPLDVEKWYEVLLVNARAAATDRQWSLAYEIARKVDDAYAPGVVVRDRPLGERDDYTSLVWLAGITALEKLGRPGDAIGQFERYARAARTPQTQSKGLYWAGRAAQAAGKPEVANQFYAQAAQFFDQFHGQLASERLGRPIPAPAPSQRTVEVSAAQRQAYQNREIVRAARYLGRQGNWIDQTQFVRAIAAQSETDLDHLFATELATQINRPDLGVMVGRNARTQGFTDYVRAAFPEIRVPAGHENKWTMIHAIARQESQFDREAVSHAGARGLMQLMPGTARETAGKIGLGYDFSGLTRNPTYNIQLGSTYFSRMMDYYGGSYLLAVAAYNAGPGNVNKWLAANGDPRRPGTDVLMWIENIPLSETRGYVQRVLENAVVYDLLNPGKAAVRSRTPLSTYLGKSQPG